MFNINNIIYIYKNIIKNNKILITLHLLYIMLWYANIRYSYKNKANKLIKVYYLCEVASYAKKCKFAVNFAIYGQNDHKMRYFNNKSF